MVEHEIGDRMTFVPTAMLPGSGSMSKWANAPTEFAQPVTGRVVYINREHRWLRVAWENGESTQHECFKF